MLKVMVFIDGSWLYHAQKTLREKIGNYNFQIPYGELPSLLIEQLKERIRDSYLSLVRVIFFGSIPVNVDPKDLSEIKEQQDFYERLKKDFQYETEIYEIDFKGRRLRKEDRDPNDSFVPEEKGVDVGLAVSMIHYGISQSYDIAVVVIGDADYIPALQYIHKLGKRVMIATVHGRCSRYYDPEEDPSDTKRVRSIPTVFLDEIFKEFHKEAQTKPSFTLETSKARKRIISIRLL